MTEKRFTTVELPKPNKWGIWYDGAYLSTYQVCILLNEYVDVKKENEQLKKNRFICLDCEHSGYTDIDCLCEYNDHWQDHITECEDFKELKE